MANPFETWWRESAELDNEQRNVISLPPEGSYLVKGPPGSGKTNLLLLRANYVTRMEHPNLAVITFNRTLREFIQSGAPKYAFEPNCIVTVRQFFSGLLDEANHGYKEQGEFERIRLDRLQAIQEVLSHRSAPMYDVIMLDEAQDYLAGEIEVFRALCADLFMVADSRQQIYPGDTDIAFLESKVDDHIGLTKHYRNGLPICQVADGIGERFSLPYESISPTCNYNSPDLRPSVEVFADSFAAQCEEIARRLRLQRRAYPEGFLGVICPRLREVRLLKDFLSNTDLADQLCVQIGADGYQRIVAERPIWLSTVHSAKGLEFRALHFAAAEFVNRYGPEQKRLTYTAVTRAKTALTIYHDRALPPYFDAALNVVRPLERPNADIEIAFGTD